MLDTHIYISKWTQSAALNPFNNSFIIVYIGIKLGLHIFRQPNHFGCLLALSQRWSDITVLEWNCPNLNMGFRLNHTLIILLLTQTIPLTVNMKALSISDYLQHCCYHLLQKNDVLPGGKKQKGHNFLQRKLTNYLRRLKCDTHILINN